MKKIVGFVQLFLALLLVIAAAATGVNLVLISMRPETISVVNVIIGQGILITVSYTHLPSPRDGLLSRMPSSA